MRNTDGNSSSKTITTINTTIVIVALITMIMVASNNSGGLFLPLTATVYGQSSNTTTNSNNSNNSTLPVLLIHGYMADASVWNKWAELLKKDGIAAYPITFKQSDDKCGSAAEHAKELSKIIGKIKDETGQNKVNIVGHSKGGLDARVYLANNTKDVSNLIMIGTPNAGSPLAQSSEICTPAVYDLRPGSPATEVKMNPNTKYYTIAGEWDPQLGNCQLTPFSPMEQSGSSDLPKPNDGMVPLSSVESQDYFINLGHSKSCHTNLMSDYEYGLAKDVIIGDNKQTGIQKQQQQQPSQQQTGIQKQQQQQPSQQKIQKTGVSVDLTTPTAGNMYGGDKKGSFDFSFQNNNVLGTAKMYEKPANGKVYEGWFEDKGDASGYSLSVGKFKDDDNTLSLNQTMVNPFTYTVFFVTAEPVDDPDPKPSDVVVGAKLPIPFGQ